MTDEQLQKLIAAISALKPIGGVHWETVVPVFVSALLAMLVGISMEYFKSFREKIKAERTKQKDELAKLNIATIALGYNLELVIHAVLQNILPHYDASHAAFLAVNQVPLSEPEITEFVRGVSGNYPHMMMTAPDYNFLEHDFIGNLPFVIGKEPELLKQSNWLIDHMRVLRSYLRERNGQIASANQQNFNGATFPAIRSAIQIQASIADAECVGALSVLDQIPMMAQTLERIARAYKKVGDVKTLIPPPVVSDAVVRLRAIVTPLEEAMPDRQQPKKDAG